MRRRLGVLGAAALAGALAVAGCSDAPSDRADAGNTTPTTGPTATTIPPATPEEPLSVVIAGDSVMDNLSEAVVPALDFGGEAVVSHTWLLGLTRDAASKLAMDRTVAETHADVIIVLLGVWELDPLEGEIGTPGWQQRYDEQVLDPFVDRVTVDGAHVLWLGMPATDDYLVTADLDLLNQAYADLDERDPRVTYFDLGEELDGPGGTFAEFVPNPDPTTLVRLRQTDGLHFCPNGTVLAATRVLDWISERWSVDVAPGWQTGSWRAVQGTEDGEDRCPGD
jgi:hypothetical protein